MIGIGTVSETRVTCLDQFVLYSLSQSHLALCRILILRGNEDLRKLDDGVSGKMQ